MVPMHLFRRGSLPEGILRIAPTPQRILFVLFPVVLLALSSFYMIGLVLATPFCSLGPSADSFGLWFEDNRGSLSSSDPGIRGITARMVGVSRRTLGLTLALETYQALLPLLDDPVADVRAAAALSLTRLGPATTHQVEVLIELVRNGTDEQRYVALEALTAIGPAANPATTDLKRLSRDSRWGIRYLAREALANAGPPPEHVPHLLMCEVRRMRAGGFEGIRAAWRLGRMGAAAVPPLLDTLSNGPDEVRFMAVTSLGVIGADSRAAVPELVDLQHVWNNSGDPIAWEWNCNIAEALARIAPDDPRVEPILRRWYYWG